MAKVVGIPFSEVKARLMANPEVVTAYQQAQHANEPIQIIPVSQGGGTNMLNRNIVSCTRQSERASFSFVNLFGGCQYYRVVMDFLPSGAVNVVVGGAQYRCQANQVLRVIDESVIEREDLACLTYSIEAGELSFHIPADVHEQLLAHPEFQKYRIIEREDVEV